MSFQPIKDFQAAPVSKTATPHLFSSPFGKVYLLVTDLGVCNVAFLKSDHDAAVLRAVKAHGLKLSPRARLLRGLVAELEAYFFGRSVSFQTPPYFLDGTSFQKSVWEALRTIRHGECKSYGWVASRLENPKASRAVGQAVAANPLPILVPCHRVIASDGSIGGFTGGVHIKRKLLRIEGVRVP